MKTIIGFILIIMTSITFAKSEINKQISKSKIENDRSSSSDKVTIHKSWGNLKQVQQFHNIIIAGQPDKSAFEKFKDFGGLTVINLRATSEMTFDEKKTLEDLKIKYHHIPVTSQTIWSRNNVNAIHHIVHKAAQKGPVMIHCGSGNRAASWLGAHLHLEHKFSVKKIKSISQKAGLSNLTWIKKLENFLK